MSYGQFASLYDQLMNDMPYEKWVAFVNEQRSKAGIAGNSLLDLACGTGNVTLPLVQAGYQVTGVDLSEDMLAIAHQKLTAAGVQAPLYQQDMRELDLPDTYDIVTIFCDSLNYVTEESGVQETFSKVYEHLKGGGLFLFDVHSLYKLHEIFLSGETYTVNEDEVALIWNCFEGKEPDSVDHELTFFVREEDGLYRRFDEFHTQRAYSTDKLQSWLEAAGFQLLGVIGDFEGAVTNETERMFFVAMKM